MLSLFTKQEQRFIIFLLFSLMLGLGVRRYREGRTAPDEAWRLQKAEILQQFSERAPLTVAEDKQPSAPAEDKMSVKKSLTGKININTATATELQTLPKIGPAMASRILDYQQQNGPFKSIEEIQKVKGIGPKTFEIIRDYITVQ